jgi:hypothetical protein
VEVKFFNKDAREFFLEPESVDLFIAHTPFHNVNADKYVNSKNIDPLSVDKSLQLQQSHSVEEYVDSVLKTVSHMDHALKDSGSILFVCPNGPKTFKIISRIIEETELFVNRVLVWNFENFIGGEFQKGTGTNFIFHLTYLKNIPYEINGLKSFVIEDTFGPSLEEQKMYGDMGFMPDAMPLTMSELLILTFSKEGDTVADIVGGTGSVAISALKNNRKTVYNDSSAEQVNLAKRRVSDIIEQMTKEKQNDKR